MMLSIFSCAYWPSVFLLWRNVFLDLLPNFWGAIFLFSCMNCWYISEIKPMSVALFANIFAHSVGHLFVLFIYLFAVQKLVSLFRFFLFIFISIALGGWPMKILVWFVSENVLPMFSSSSFMVSCLKVFKPFWFCFCVWWEGVEQVALSHCLVCCF